MFFKHFFWLFVSFPFLLHGTVRTYLYIMNFAEETSRFFAFMASYVLTKNIIRGFFPLMLWSEGGYTFCSWKSFIVPAPGTNSCLGS